MHRVFGAEALEIRPVSVIAEGRGPRGIERLERRFVGPLAGQGSLVAQRVQHAVRRFIEINLESAIWRMASSAESGQMDLFRTRLRKGPTDRVAQIGGRITLMPEGGGDMLSCGSFHLQAV